MRWSYLRRSLWIASLVTALLGVAHEPANLFAQDDSELDAELARQQKIADRFLVILEKNPRRGTSLDKVYGFHVENGTLDQWIGRYEKRIQADAKDGSALMMLGLVQSHRGQDAAAVAAFSKAAETLQQDPLPAYYLGQSLVLVGQPEKAVEAFEKAIERKPAQNDLLEIFQALGRVHQRAQRGDEALAVWTRLEKLFPNDSRVQEQIVATLVEEGQFAQALPRYESLLKGTKDDYRRSVYRMEAAELKVKLNRSSEAIADLEQLLASLNPSSWLHREVRRKIEEVFLRTDDQDGLAKYYEGWVKKNPEDVDAMARLARILARQTRVPEAQTWLDNALKLAPTRKELRLAFIEQLVDDQRYPEAIAQYEILDKTDPNNPDWLRERGKLILRDTSRPRAERLKAAEQVWRRLVAARPKDPLIATQVADLLRHSQMNDAALELYRKAVELAPSDPQYREYLGEFYHQLDRRDEALATWRPIAEGKQRTAANVARLAEVFATFGYLDQATVEIEAACKLDPKDFALHLKAAELLSKAQRYEAALEKLGHAETLSQNTEEAEGVLASQLKIYQFDESLAKRATQLEAEAKAGSASAAKHYLLARHQEALQKHAEATQAIEAALKIEPKSIPALATAARVYEQAGDLTSAATLNRRLAVVDRRGRSDYLKHVSQLETQLGRTDQALAAGQELLVSAPGNTENLEFYADLCFRLGKVEDGLDTLRRAVRLNPGEPNILMRLASALAEQFRTDEAIEIYWQAYDKAESLDDKLNVVQKLADLHLETNHLDRLLERIERQRADADEKREATICLAQVHQTAGDYGMARQELESLLSENTRDTQLLQQLSKLAETEADLTSAVKYQEQLAQVAPGPEAEYRLATLLARNGQSQQSAEIIVRLALREEDPEKLLRNIDSLLATDQQETALLVIEQRLRDDPKNWELLYRQGVALKANPEAAKLAFDAILQLPQADEETGVAEKNRRAKAAKQQGVARNASASMLNSRLDYSYQIRAAIGLLSEDYYPVSRATIWTPSTFAQARMAAFGWLYQFAEEPDAQTAMADRYKQAADADNATPRMLWDSLYLMAIAGSLDGSDSGQNLNRLAIARRLAETGDPAGQYLFLTSLETRFPQPANSGTAKENASPLSPADMDLALKCYDALRNRAAGDGNARLYSITRIILTELRRSGRLDEEQQLSKQALARTTTPEEINQALLLTIHREDVPGALTLFDKWSQLVLNDPKKASGPYGQPMYYALCQFIGTVGAAKRHDDVLAILDHYLDHHQAAALKAAQKFKPRTGQAAGGSTYLAIWYGKSQRGVQLPLPSSTRYYDVQSLQVLRNAYEIFKRHDLTSDFEKHLAGREQSAGVPGKIFERLALAYVCEWNEEPQRAAEHLRQAGELAPQDPHLRMEVARYHVKEKEYDDALDLIDGFSPIDQDTLRQRETLALDLAVRLGDQDRARQAAERLFGLRLDPESQVHLADQMRRLGMNDHAQAVLSRAQRQAGNRLTALTALMNSHQSQGKSDIAAQIAHQILRRSRTPTSSSSPNRGMTADDQARQSALQVLSAAGKLKEMIAAVHQQLERSPQATQLYDTLAEYYEASGDRTKALEWQAKILELRPDKVDERLRYANKLLAAGKAEEACEQFEIVIRKQPGVLRNNFYEISQAFRQAKKQADFAAVLSEINLSSIGQYHYVMDHVRTMLADPSQKAAGLALLKRTWDAFPTQRQYILTSFYDESIWSIPELYEYGKQSLLPTALAVQQDPWYGINRITSYSGDGQVNTVLNRVLLLAEKANGLPSLRAEIEASTKEFPDWKAGPVLLAILDARAGKAAAARETFEKIGNNEKDMPTAASRIVAQELEKLPELRSIAITLYERALKDADASGGTLAQFQYGPGPRLMRLYSEAERREEAHRLLAAAEKESVGSEYDPAYAESQRISHLRNIAKHYNDLEFKVDALRLYRQVIISSEAADPAVRQQGSLDYYKQEAERELATLVASLQQSRSTEVIEQLLTPKASADREPAIDLLVAARVNAASGIPQIDSQLLALLGGKQALSPEQVATATAQIAKLCTEDARDFGAHVVAVILALQSGDDAQAKQAIEKLASLLKSQPLEPLSGNRANARQRDEAEAQIPVWLAAQVCFVHPQWQAPAEQFAARAVEAARRVPNRNFVSAILFAQSNQALEAKQPEAAQKHLRELLDFVTARPVVKKPRSPAATTTPAVDGGNGENGAKPTAAASHVPPLALSQFQLAMAIANLAAENGFVELAQAAVREALAGGLPVLDVDPALSNSSGRTRITTFSPDGEENGPNSSITQAVATSLGNLSQSWRERGLSAEAMYSVLHDVVLPPGQPEEVALFPRPNPRPVPSNLASDLAGWAVAAGKADELRSHLKARSAGPAKLRAIVALATLNVQAGDYAAASEQIKVLADPGQFNLKPHEIPIVAQTAGMVFRKPELKTAAIPLLERLQEVSGSSQSVNYVSASIEPGSVTDLLAQHYRSVDDKKNLQRVYDEYLKARQTIYARYAGDSGLSQQRYDVTNVATRIASAGDIDLTLDYLGKFLDLPAGRDQYGQSSNPISLWNLTWQTRRLPAEDRYRRLRDWTLPTENRRSLRFLTAFLADSQLPATFFDKAEGGPLPSTELVSNFTLLVEAAKEAGTLDELSSKAQLCVADKLEHAQTLAGLVAAASGSDETVEHVKRLITDLRERKQSTDPNNNSLAENSRHWDDLLLLDASLSSVARADAQIAAPLVLQDLRKNRQYTLSSQAAGLIARRALSGLSANEKDSIKSPGLKLWTVGTPPQMTTSESPPAWWTAHDKFLSHITGFDHDSLFFNYPLTGTFEFSFEVHGYDFSQGQVAYGGLLSHPQFWAGNVQISPISRHETVIRAGTVEARDWWNQYSVKVTPESIRFFSNGHLVYEETEPSPTSPWLHLVSLDHRRTTFRNLRLAGNPSIPAQVTLTHAERLEGWVGLPGEKLPSRISTREPARKLTPQARLEAPDQRPNDWQAIDGVIHGRVDSQSSYDIQSRLQYHRPLLNGDTLSYEFHYEPERIEVHPALGRLAFLLQPDGVRLHWINPGSMSIGNPLGLSDDNMREEPGNRRGPQQLPLVAGEWNRVQVSLAGDVASIRLNDVLVFQRAMEPVIDRRFGLFHFKDKTSVQVRNVVLRGNWPQELPAGDREQLLTLANDDESPAMTRARHALVREEEQADEVLDVYRMAVSLPPDERYALLESWVLPGLKHPTFRLQTAFPPTDLPIAQTGANAAKPRSIDDGHRAGGMVSPAIQLVRTAAELNRLDELTAKIIAAQKESPDQLRDALALLLLVSIEQQDDPTSVKLLGSIQDQLKKLDGSTPAWRRHAEITAVLGGLQRPTLQKHVLPIAEMLVENQHSNYVTVDWERRVRWLRAKARWQDDPVVGRLPMGQMQPIALKQWASVSSPRAEVRGQALPPPTWRVEKGKADFFTGRAGDALYFQSPLTGNFELRCRRTTYGWKEIRAQYAGIAMDVVHDGKAIIRQTPGRAESRIPLNELLPKWGPMIDYRLVVQDGAFTVFMNDKQVHSERLPIGADPWLCFRTAAGHFNGSIEDVRITGKPQVPDSIDLTASPELLSWQSDYYGDTIGNADSLWIKDKEEIVGKLHEYAPGSQRENLLQYHRPLLEDGAIEYEFFYEKGTTEVAPALGRFAYMIQPDGVYVHQLTDGAYDRTGIDPGNRERIAGSKSPRLKEGDWNQVQLKLVGDEVQLKLNGDLIAQSTLAPSQPRQFGFFRYADEVSARIRRVTHKGEWPKSIPSPAEQELAAP